MVANPPRGAMYETFGHPSGLAAVTRNHPLGLAAKSGVLTHGDAITHGEASNTVGTSTLPRQSHCHLQAYLGASASVPSYVVVHDVHGTWSRLYRNPRSCGTWLHTIHSHRSKQSHRSQSQGLQVGQEVRGPKQLGRSATRADWLDSQLRISTYCWGKKDGRAHMQETREIPWRLPRNWQTRWRTRTCWSVTRVGQVSVRD